MATVNQNWYNLNESRDYPLVDNATALDNDQNHLPQSIIADIRVRWPEWAGKYAFLGSVAVTPGAVTVTVLVSTDLTNTSSSYIPITVVSVPLSSLQPGRQYPMKSMYPGSFGYIVFGSGTTLNYSGRFSSPEQSCLTPRSARSHAGLPVTSLGKLYDQVPLTGLVNLVGEAPLTITQATRVIDGNTKKVVLFSLVAETETIVDVATGGNILQLLAGDCGRRPESGSCGSPEPIEYINAVGPDCNGTVTLEFTGCAIVGRNTADDSIIIDCTTDIDETCEPPFLPSLEEGRLPSEFTPIPPTTPVPPPPPPTGPDSISSAFETPVSLPYCDNFSDGVADHFYDVGYTIGETTAWIYDDDTSSPEDICRDESVSDSVSVIPTDSFSTRTESGVSSRNMQVWSPGPDECSSPNDCDQTIYRTFTTDIRVVVNNLPENIPDSSSILRNGGILTNYRINPTTGGKTFWIAEAEIAGAPQYESRFSIHYFDGLIMRNVIDPSNGEPVSITGIDIYPDVWYRLSLNVAQEENNDLNQNIMLSATLVGPLEAWQMNPSPPQISLSLGPVPIHVDTYINNDVYEYGESGLAGFHTNRSATQFSCWQVEDNRI